MDKDDSQSNINQVKELILSDSSFKKALLFDLLSWTIKAIGWGGAIIGILIAFFGYNSLSNLAETTMNDFLKSKGSEFEKQFNRLSQIPSYVMIGSNLTVNNQKNNFIPLPLFSDIKRRANFDECEYFFSPYQLKGSSIEFKVTKDTLDNIPGFRINSLNQIVQTTTSNRHSPQGDAPTRLDSSYFDIRFFIFASRDIK